MTAMTRYRDHEGNVFDTIRAARLAKLDEDAPIPPEGLRPQHGVEYGCGDWGCTSCYEPDVDDDQIGEDGRRLPR